MSTVPHSVRDAGALTPAGFPRICQHRHEYGMTCEQFDQLEERAGGRCEICGVAPRKLHIDHDHDLGFRAVRGLLCPKCNARMRRVDSYEQVADAAVVAYMQNPFWKTLYPRPGCEGGGESVPGQGASRTEGRSPCPRRNQRRNVVRCHPSFS